MNTPCPGEGTGSFEDNMGCRRHDHGDKYEPGLFGLPRLECGVDYDLTTYTNNWAADAMYGSWGLGTALGCYNWEYFQNCWWSCGWRGCDRHCSGHWGWDTHYGPWRYSGINHRGNSMYEPKDKVCPGDIW